MENNYCTSSWDAEDGIYWFYMGKIGCNIDYWIGCPRSEMAFLN